MDSGRGTATIIRMISTSNKRGLRARARGNKEDEEDLNSSIITFFTTTEIPPHLSLSYTVVSAVRRQERHVHELLDPTERALRGAPDASSRQHRRTWSLLGFQLMEDTSLIRSLRQRWTNFLDSSARTLCDFGTLFNRRMPFDSRGEACQMQSNGGCYCCWGMDVVNVTRDGSAYRHS